MLNITSNDETINLKIIQYFEIIILTKMETSPYPKYS